MNYNGLRNILDGKETDESLALHIASNPSVSSDSNLQYSLKNAVWGPHF
jgi:hypothetical protein